MTCLIKYVLYHPTSTPTLPYRTITQSTAHPTPHPHPTLPPLSGWFGVFQRTAIFGTALEFVCTLAYPNIVCKDSSFRYMNIIFKYPNPNHQRSDSDLSLTLYAVSGCAADSHVEAGSKIIKQNPWHCSHPKCVYRLCMMIC